MKISICVDAIYHGKDFIQSLTEIQSLGVSAFEFWTWWDKDLPAIQQAKNQLHLEVAAFCTRFISLVDRSKRDEYLEGLRESIEIAKILGCQRLISQVGNDIGIPRRDQAQNLIEGLKTCVPLLERSGITLVFEPLNTLVDHPGYYLSSSEEAFAIAEAVDSPYVKVLFDIYHQQIMEGDLIRRIQQQIRRIGHFHAAGNPGRHELYFGEINYPAVFKAIDETGYDGYVGFEYFPLEPPAQGIKAFLS